MRSLKRKRINSKRSMNLFSIKHIYGTSPEKQSRNKIGSLKSKYEFPREGHNHTGRDQWLMWRFYSEQQRHFEQGEQKSKKKIRKLKDKIKTFKVLERFLNNVNALTLKRKKSHIDF